MLPVILALITGNIGNIIKKIKFQENFLINCHFRNQNCGFKFFLKNLLYIYIKERLSY